MDSPNSVKTNQLTSQNYLAVYQHRKDNLLTSLQQIDGPISIQKKTSSNLFRYQPRQKQNQAKKISLKEFNHVLYLDKAAQTLEVEGLTTYETIVNHTLAQGFLPTVAPELKHITIGGATVGIGIESTGFKYGFVHDGLLEAEVLLPNGQIVVCNATNQHADLFHALPNSYGTLGYILKAKIKVYPAKPFVHLQNMRFDTIKEYINALEKASLSMDYDFIEGLFYSDKELYLTLGKLVASAPHLTEIYKDNIFYKTIHSEAELYLRTVDYIFRFDPEWFWNIPETPLYNYFRKYAPQKLRNSGFYKKYTHYKRKFLGWMPNSQRQTQEPLIQDWEVPWDKAVELVEFTLKNVDIQGRPWVALPIKPLTKPTSYPLEPNKLYFNLGCYCHIDKSTMPEEYYFTKILDNKCFELGGIKMLYSSTFINKEAFDRIYNGHVYQQVKQKYDPKQQAATLYEKAVSSIG